MSADGYGKQNTQTEKKTDWRKRLAVMAGIIIVGMFVGTQYLAYEYGYHEALGFNAGGLYPPWNIAVWWFSWGQEPDSGNLFSRAWLITGLICIVGMIAFLVVMNILANTGKNKGNLHGTARWAELKDVIEATLLPHPKATGKDGKPKKPEGVFVGGWVNPKSKQFVYLRHNGPEHVLCYAPTRSGKGVGLVNPTLLSWPESTIITDIKGELWELTAGWRKKHAKNKVIRFEPASTNSAHWNVFDSIRFGTEYEERDVGNVASLIVDPDGKGLEDHWAKTAYSLLVGCILHVHYKWLTGTSKERNLAAVDAMLSNPDQPLEKTWTEMKENKHQTHDRNGVKLEQPQTHKTVAQAGQDMLDRAEAEGASVLSTAKSFLSLYRDPVIAENTRTSDFTIHQIANSKDPVSLYIITKPADLTRIRPIFRLMITMVIGVLADELKPVKGRMERMNKYRTLLMLDEFPSLGKLDVMQRALAFIAGYGLKAYLITQDLSQLYAAYGKDEAITSNCHVQIAYPPNRPETARHISDLTGGTSVMVEEVNVSGSRTSFFQNNVSITKREQARNLLTQDEVLRLPAPKKDANGNITEPGHMLIFCAGLPAIYGQQILYFQDPYFKARSEVPAPEKTDSLIDEMPKTTMPVFKVEEKKPPEPPAEPMKNRFSLTEPQQQGQQECKPEPIAQQTQMPSPSAPQSPQTAPAEQTAQPTPQAVSAGQTAAAPTGPEDDDPGELDFAS